MRNLSHRRHRMHAHVHKDLPYGVRILAWTRAIRWIGWGLGEALIPVLILQFSSTYAEMGLFSSFVDISSLICLPIIGLWADKVSSRKLVLISLLLYPFVGISYFLAGLLAMAIFIVVARLINGFTWEVENIGIETYFRRATSDTQIGTSFGYVEMWSHVAWIVAALVGMILVPYVGIPYLLLGIAPFALIAYAFALRAPVDYIKNNSELETESSDTKFSVFKSYGNALEEWRGWDLHLWLLGALVLFSGIINALVWFFIPIDAYVGGANLSLVILLTIIGALPALFSYKLGKIADIKNEYTLIAIGLIMSSLIALGLGIIPYYWFKLVGSLLFGIILELFYVVQNRLITTLGPSETYGRRGSAFESLITLGDMLAPLLIGIGLDLVGFGNIALIVALTAFVLGVMYKSVSRKWEKTRVRI